MSNFGAYPGSIPTICHRNTIKRIVLQGKAPSYCFPFLFSKLVLSFCRALDSVILLIPSYTVSSTAALLCVYGQIDLNLEVCISNIMCTGQ
jgi:hypothetical protein